MFQLSGVKLFLLLLIAACMAGLWYLDSKYYHWDGILPEPDEMVIESVPPESAKNDTFKSNEFVPTDEWQTLKEDQPIPPGLHVQINLQTGEKKAKLMEGNSNSKINSLAIAHANNTDIIGKSKDVPVTENKFKTYKELKEELKDLNLTVKSDMEKVDELSIKFKEHMKIYDDSEENIKNILTDLEYLLHQVDTAEVFVKNKGIESIIIPCINSNSNYLKSQGALLMGSAASNNPKVQIAALTTDIIQLLLNNINKDYSFSVQKNSYYALGTIARRFPAAQKQIIDKHGIELLLSVFKRLTSDLNTKLKVKVSQFFQDLVLEIEDAKLTLQEESNEQLSSIARERVQQYNDLHLKDKLVENGWCEILGNEFITLSNSLPSDGESHDMVEVYGKSLLALNDLCKAKLKGNNLLYKSLYLLEVHYKKLFQQDVFFKPLYQLASQLSNTYDPVHE